MTALAVGIITLKQPEGLKRLLAGLAAQQPGQQEQPFTVVVVDNDASGSSRTICEEARSQYNLPLTYVVEPMQGIPQARNRVLASVPDDCQLLAWIDDDETPSVHWLSSLVSMQKETEADIVMGAVEAILPEETPEWIHKGGFFNRRRFVDRATLSEGATNNCLMRLAALNAAGLRFNEKLRLAGGSDTLFFRQAAQKGLRMVWSAEAVVKEHISSARCTLGWLARRNFRSGITLAICDTELNGISGWLRRFWYGLLKIFQGLINLPLGFEGRHEITKSLLKIVRGFGMIAGLFGIRSREHALGRVTPPVS